MADDFFKNWKIILMLAFLFGSFAVMAINGLKFGMDFEGGTIFQIHLAEPVEGTEEMSRVVSTISQRLDWTGLKDTKIAPWGKEFIVVQMAETNPENVERIEALLKKQGRFEVTLDGEVIFTGEEIIKITKDPSKGYGFRKEGDLILWILPFTLKSSAATNFKQKTFHRCTVVSYDPTTGSQYDCDRTYFYIDKPVNSILIMPRDVYESDKLLFLSGNRVESIPQNIKVDEVLLNSGLKYFIVDENLSEEQIASLQEIKSNSGKGITALIPADLDAASRQKLSDIGFAAKEIDALENVPWIWTATNTRQIISLSEDVTNMDVARIEDAETFSDLIIRGYASDTETAKAHLTDLTVLLESGSLSTPVESISKETISPLLGDKFLLNVALMGVVAAVLVSLVVFIRYKIPKIIIPILFTVFSEIVILLGFASLIKWNLDLAAVAGVIVVVGTGVNDQIIIVDELRKGAAEAESTSMVNRVKRAFFIVFAAASTIIAAMLPLFLFGFGFGKLIGFAITTIAGVLIGVLITRPAFGEIAKRILQ